MRRRLLQHLGLVRPYQFERTLLVLAALALLFLVSIVSLYLALRGHIAAGTPRSWYVVYVVGLLAVVIVLVPLPRLAAIVLVLATLEAGIGFGSLVLFKLGLLPYETLAPANKRGGLRIGWHPLLQGLPVPNSEEDARHTARINSERMRGPERTAEQLRGKIVVALFGGSTTFDGGQHDGESWPDRLQETLGSRYVVINHGMGAYTTAEHVIQTAFYERAAGMSPTCSVYYVGWNDLRNAHIENLDPGYADFHMPNQVDAFEARRTDIDDSFSPLATFIGRWLGRFFDTIRPTVPKGTVSPDPDPAFDAIFARNLATISAINRQRNIRTVWLGQLMNQTMLTGNYTTGHLPLLKEKDIYPLIQHLNEITRREAVALGDPYVALPVDGFANGGFRDQGHFTPTGSKLFATLLAPSIRDYCR
jgi:lysophospholipase L1-like esterase